MNRKLDEARAEIERLNQERQIILLDLHDKNAEIERLKGLIRWVHDRDPDFLQIDQGPDHADYDAPEKLAIADIVKGQK